MSIRPGVWIAATLTSLTLWAFIFAAIAAAT